MALHSESIVNIPVKDENNDEAMDIDEELNVEIDAVVIDDELEQVDADNELEEGELSNDDEPITEPVSSTQTSQRWTDKRNIDFESDRRYENRGGGFVTGVDIFSKEGREKLAERAKRFGINESECKSISESELNDLYESLGMSFDKISNEKKGYRLDTIHVRGTEEMSTQDLFDYFSEYYPASIEWINDVSCNVVWLDETSPCRAFIGMSKPISGLTQSRIVAAEKEMEEVMVVAEEGETLDEEELPLDDKPSDVPPLESDKKEVDENKRIIEGSIAASDISVPIPPGYWRLGKEFPKAKYILFRYATRADKKPKQAEKMSEYYKKYGNPNYGGIKGIISTSRKRRFQSRPDRDNYSKDDAVDSKNPWGSIAENWGELEKPRRTGYVDQDDPAVDLGDVRRKIVDARVIIKSHRNNPPPPPPTVHSSETDGSEHLLSDSSDDSDNWRKRLKRPKMKMYADQEEEKVMKKRISNEKMSTIIKSTPVVVASTSVKDRLGSAVGSSDVSISTKRPSVWERLSETKSANKYGKLTPKDVSKLSHYRNEVGDLRHALSKNKPREGDLRNRLSRKKRTNIPQYKKSPLTIQIQNDEYVSSSDEESSSDSESSSSGSSSSGSSSSSSSDSSSSSSESESESESESASRSSESESSSNGENKKDENGEAVEKVVKPKKKREHKSRAETRNARRKK